MKLEPITLLELNRKIKKTIKENIDSCWVYGEISEIKENYSGHCYLELIQKDETGDQIVARSRATIWSVKYRMIKPYFETTTGQALNVGLSILVKVATEFHELYGLSLNILDIEPTYTVGELAIRKQKIIARLQDEGVFDMNRELEFPFLCQKIAVISSATAAGYEDFTDQLKNNPFGFRFYVKLFQATMQGEETERSVVKALEKIYSYDSFFDAVVIIRGGGSQADLNAFNNYEIAYHVAQFPLPIFTGIGHEQDDTVTDMVAHTRLKTPTAVAAFLIDHFTTHSDRLTEVQENILAYAGEKTDAERGTLKLKAKDFQIIVAGYVSNESARVVNLKHSLSTFVNHSIYRNKIRLFKTESGLHKSLKLNIVTNVNNIRYFSGFLKKAIKYKLTERKNNLEDFNRQLKNLDPDMILKRGYSITLQNGRVLKDTSDVNDNGLIETLLYKGKLISKLIRNSNDQNKA
jgi:exodeoxyribonuclease VII large subunit